MMREDGWHGRQASAEDEDPATLRLDPAARAAWIGDRRIRLTATELALAAALAETPAGLDRAALLARVWNLHFDPGTNLVAVHVHRLRAKIGPERIAPTPGGGYRLRGHDGEKVIACAGTMAKR